MTAAWAILGFLFCVDVTALVILRKRRHDAAKALAEAIRAQEEEEAKRQRQWRNRYWFLR